MDLINWTEDYSVGVKELDLQHQKIIEMIHQLARALMTDQEQEVASQVLNDIHSYIIDHFSLEERLLHQAKYPDLEAHKANHNQYIKQFSYLCAEVDAQKADAVPHLIAYLNDWWNAHILKEDMKYKPVLGK